MAHRGRMIISQDRTNWIQTKRKLTLAEEIEKKNKLKIQKIKGRPEIHIVITKEVLGKKGKLEKF